MLATAGKGSLGIQEERAASQIAHQILLLTGKENATAIMDFNLPQTTKIVSQLSSALQIVRWAPQVNVCATMDYTYKEMSVSQCRHAHRTLPGIKTN